MTRRIGIYPGTFDPFHQGHFAFCLQAVKECQIDGVILLPERHPRYKPFVSSFEKRLEDVRMVVDQVSFLEVRDLHCAKFTVRETLPELKREFPDSELCLLIGSDVACSLSKWENIDRLLREVSLAVGLRKGSVSYEVEQSIEDLRLQGITPRYKIITTEYSEVASTHIRSGAMKVNFSELLVEKESVFTQ